MITANRLALGSADRKRAVTFLRCKITDANLIVHPTGRNGLQLAKHISKAVRRAKADQQMHVSETPLTLSAIPSAVRMMPPR